MNCEDLRTFLPAYLDDELGIAESLPLQKHLEVCARCRQDQEAQLALRASLRDPDLSFQPSAAFAKRMEQAVRRRAREEAREQPANWIEFLRFRASRWVPAAAVAGIVAVAAGWFIVHNGNSAHQQLIASAALASHIRSLQAEHLVDVPSSDRHTVKPWFQGKLDFSPPVPDLSEMGWILIGGRLDYLDGRPVAALVYQRRMHNINVFLWPDRGAARTGIEEEDAQGYQILHWNGADMTYWVVSDLNKDELTDFAKALRGH